MTRHQPPRTADRSTRQNPSPPRRRRQRRRAVLTLAAGVVTTGTPPFALISASSPRDGRSAAYGGPIAANQPVRIMPKARLA